MGAEASGRTPLELIPPASLVTALPAYAEAIAGRTITSEGNSEPVADRAARLAAAYKLIDELPE